jgi:ABC-type arginine transport system ATPase subunit
MFPECRLLDEKLDPFNRIALKESCVINFQKVVRISEVIVTHFVQVARAEAHCVGYIIEPFEYSVG